MSELIDKITDKLIDLYPQFRFSKPLYSFSEY
jgi:hypothetical protein